MPTHFLYMARSTPYLLDVCVWRHIQAQNLLHFPERFCGLFPIHLERGADVHWLVDRVWCCWHEIFRQIFELTEECKSFVFNHYFAFFIRCVRIGMAKQRDAARVEDGYMTGFKVF